MYAIIEFEEKKCSVVPFNWLTDEEKKCYWPKTVSLQMVKNSKQPALSWPKFNVIKIHQTVADYDEAHKILEKLLEESSSSSETGAMQQSLLNMLQPNVTTAGHGEQKKRQREEDDFSNESLSDFSDDEPSNGTISLASTVTDVNQFSPYCASPQASPSSNASNTDSLLLQTILRKVEHIVGTQHQHSLILNNILSTNQQSSGLEKPSNFPNLPVDTKQEYKAVEDFLKIKENFNYMKYRLACIGGTGVRSAVMNMLKFILNDKVAIKFNWAGRDKKKRPFKETLMSKVIQEAIMSAFSKHIDRQDVTDKCIQDAIKDWLKLAKHRLDNKFKKLQIN